MCFSEIPSASVFQIYQQRMVRGSIRRLRRQQRQQRPQIQRRPQLEAIEEVEVLKKILLIKDVESNDEDVEYELHMSLRKKVYRFIPEEQIRLLNKVMLELKSQSPHQPKSRCVNRLFRYDEEDKEDKWSQHMARNQDVQHGLAMLDENVVKQIYTFNYNLVMAELCKKTIMTPDIETYRVISDIYRMGLRACRNYSFDGYQKRVKQLAPRWFSVNDTIRRYIYDLEDGLEHI